MAGLHAVTVDELRQLLTPMEAEAVAEAVGASAVGSWMGALLLRACDRVVGALNGCPHNTRISTGLCKVPEECVNAVLVLARHAVLGAVPALSEVLEGSTRAAEYQAALADLRAMACGELRPGCVVPEADVAEGAAGCIGLVALDDVDWMV